MDLDISKKNKNVCIVKIPKFLADKILELNYDCEIGELSTSEGSEPSNPKISLKLHSIFMGSFDFPAYHDIKKVARNNMYVVESTKSEALVEGKVKTEYFIKPQLNKQYLNFKKLQASERLQYMKSTEVIDYKQEGKRSEKLGSLRELDYLARKRKKMLIEKKRERLEKEDVLDIVFNAFEKYNSWTVKDLADFTGQPIAFIQEIVSEICVLNKKDHKNSYELKPEYK